MNAFPSLSARKERQASRSVAGAGPGKGRTCTCGIGEWDLRGQCETCGGFDLGMPYLDPANHIVLQQQPDGRIKAWLP